MARNWAIRAKVAGWPGSRGVAVYCLACSQGWVPVAVCFTVPVEARHIPRWFRTKAEGERWAREYLKQWAWEVVEIVQHLSGRVSSPVAAAPF